MNSSDLRQRARDALKGNWFVMVVAGFVASLLGGVASSSSFSVDVGSSEEITDAELDALMTQLGITEEMLMAAFTIIGLLAIVGMVYSVICFIVGSGVSSGYAQLNLDLVDGRSVSVGTVFSRFGDWKTVLVARLLTGLRVFLWSLLFVIPGIIAAYDYEMVNFVIAEQPYLSASEAMAESKRLMRGNRWRLFCLEISFFGWAFLSALTLGVGNLWLTPYVQASKAAFYRQIKREASYTV